MIPSIKYPLLTHFPSPVNWKECSDVTTCPLSSNAPSVPSAPPRGVDVVVLNATSARVSWKPPVAERQHGAIRGYQVTYVRRTAGERTGSPRIKELLLRDSQVGEYTSLTKIRTYTLLKALCAAGLLSKCGIFLSNHPQLPKILILKK